MLNYDNNVDRRAIEACIRTGKLLINPIADWSEEDVWEFHAQYNIPHCSLYDEGFNRLGCVLCPMGGPKKMKREMQRWPQYRKMYKQAFEKMLEKRKEKGLETKWKTADEVMAWWIGEDTNNNAPGMMETVR